MTRLRHCTFVLILAALSLPAAAQFALRGDPGGLRIQHGPGRGDAAGWKKGREAHPPPRRDDGGGSTRLTPEQREQLRRDLDRANREIYNRRRRD